ncbi:hypothetical protein pkur_cds_349 [Pandoravirus kuranda]|uniref:Uncharacterized protein n=1 Tax=Pandoravirus kuranda TaxID=3019033 RepID=A0AA95EDS5_9VIRU|nr:hypothetical protein pkur_cds_349 [Pandoravirus kuranda]
MTQMVRVSWDGVDASAYDVMRHVFGWGRMGRSDTLRALAAGVRATGFCLGSRTLPGGGKPTVTFAVADVHAFLGALQEAAPSANEKAATVAAYRCGPSALWLVRHLADPAPPRVRKYSIASRGPLLLQRQCKIRPAPKAAAAGAATQSPAPLIDDVTRDAVRLCGDIILAALRTATQHVEASDDGDDDRTRKQRAGPQCAEREQGSRCTNGNDASPMDLHFVETRTLSLATAAKPLRVWCTGERVGVRMCAVWPTGAGHRWGVSLPRSNGSIDFMGSVSRPTVVRMLARLLAVPGVVAVASPVWSSVHGPTVGPEVRGAHALCALANDADDEADEPPLCCLSVFLPRHRHQPSLSSCSDKCINAI